MRYQKFLAGAAAAALLAIGGVSAASAQDHRAPDQHRPPTAQHAMHRPYVAHDRLVTLLGQRHYRVIGDPYFVRGHYVVRTHDRRGRTVVVEVDPYSGAFIGTLRI